MEIKQLEKANIYLTYNAGMLKQSKGFKKLAGTFISGI